MSLYGKRVMHAGDADQSVRCAFTSLSWLSPRRNPLKLSQKAAAVRWFLFWLKTSKTAQADTAVCAETT